MIAANRRVRVYLAFQGLTPNVITGTSTVKTQNGISPGESVPVVRLPREMNESGASCLTSGDGRSHQRGTTSAAARGLDEGTWLEGTSPGSKPSWRRILHAGYGGAREWSESGRPRPEME